MTKVFIDIETTGLDVDHNELVEVAWAIEDGPIHDLLIPHTTFTAAPIALEINKYKERNLGDRSKWASDSEISELYRDLDGTTLVGANPRFDAGFLRKLFKEEPWSHRLLDVEAYAAGVFGWEKPKGLKSTQEALRDVGFDIPVPDHSAAGDVETTRAVYKALRTIAAKHNEPPVTLEADILLQSDDFEENKKGFSISAADSSFYTQNLKTGG